MDKLKEWFDASRGRQKELAGALGVYPSTFASWKQVPAERVRAVSVATGIPDYDLRPDIFPSPKPPAPVTAFADVSPSEVANG